MSQKIPTRTGYKVGMRLSNYDRLNGFLHAGSKLAGSFAAILFLFWISMNSNPENLVPVFRYGQAAEDPFDQAQVLMFELDDKECDDKEWEVFETNDSIWETSVQAVDFNPSIQSRLAKIDGELRHIRTIGYVSILVKPQGLKPSSRWQLNLTAESREAYFEQLDFFEIELGLVSKQTERIDIISSLTAQPTIRTTNRNDEPRAYFVQSNNQLMNWDLRLAVKVTPFSDRDSIKKNNLIVHFYPDQLTKELEQLETEFAKQKSLDIRKVRITKFAARKTGDKYEFYVQDMETY